MNIKRGQISFYLIIGLSLILIMGIILFVNKQNIPFGVGTVSKNQLDINPIKQYIDSCLETTSNDGLKLIGLQGGYYDLEDNFATIFFTEKVPYYFYKGDIFIPSINFVQDELSKYVIDNLDKCLKEFEIFKKEGYLFILGKKNVETTITKVEITFGLDYPITVKKYDSSTYLNLFSFSQDSKIDEIINISRRIVGWYERKPGFICLSCLDDMDIDYNNFDLNIYSLFDEMDTNNVLLVNIIDKSNRKGNYTYKFVLHYPDEFKEFKSYQVQIKDIPDQNIKIGYEYYYKVEADGDNIRYYDDSNLFNISSNGIINFTPSINQIGNYLIKVGIEDVNGNSDFDFFRLNISSFFKPLKLRYIGYLTGKVGEEFIYDVNVSSVDEKTLSFFDSTDLFDISRGDGIIKFIPKQDDIGEYIIDINIIDSNGMKDTGKIHLNIMG